MAALVAERPETPIAAPLPPAQSRPAWRDPGPRSSAPAPPAGWPRSVEQAARELVERHLPAASKLGSSALMPSVAVFAGPAGHAELDVAARVFVHEEGPQTLRAVLLVADPLVALLAATGLDEERRGGGGWILLPNGSSVTARADALRLLRAMREPGAILVAAEDGQFRIGPLGIGGESGDWDDGEWRLFEDLAALEEWSGTTIAVPDQVDDETSTRITQAALWVRTQRIPARVGGRVAFRTRGRVDASDADELRVLDDELFDLGWQVVHLGRTVVRLPIRVLEVGDREPDGTVPVIAETPRRDVELALVAPEGRRLPPRRTQAVDAAGPPHAQTGLASELAELGLEPVAVAQAPLRQVAAELTHAPVRSAASVDALLDDLRGP